MKSLLAPISTLGLVVLFSFAFSSCGNDNAVLLTELSGRWEITEAFRNGKATDTMEGMFFEFTEDGQLTTNMTGAEETYQYELDGDQIEQREGTIETDYTIESLESNQLVLTMTLSGKPFRLILEQAAE